jgi:hypothetical protein
MTSAKDLPCVDFFTAPPPPGALARAAAISCDTLGKARLGGPLPCPPATWLSKRERSVSSWRVERAVSWNRACSAAETSITWIEHSGLLHSASTVRPSLRKSLSGRVPPVATIRVWAAISCAGRSSGCNR